MNLRNRSECALFCLTLQYVTVMCRYSWKNYKSHFACFKCRKAFKQPPICDWLMLHNMEYAYDQLLRLWGNKPKLRLRESELGITYDELVKKYQLGAHRCPQCGEQMVDMGLDFKPPKQVDKKAWRLLHGMFRVGHCFYSCGCNGPGWIPKTTADYRKYLQDRRRNYQANIRNLRRATSRTAAEKDEASAYWGSLINAVDKELKSLD